MEVLTLDELRVLAQQPKRLSISIFMPAHRAGRDTQQGPIRFRNLLRDAENQLRDHGMRAPDVTALLQPAHALLEDHVFWQHQQDGLAVYLAEGDFHAYRLPVNVEEQVVIDSTYYFKPILPLFTNNGHYYILAISQNEVRLFEGTRHSVGQIELPQGAPASMEEALPLEDKQPQVMARSSTAQGSMFYGQGQGEEVVKERIGRYLNIVDAGLRPWYKNLSAPVVLAGVEYLLPIYRRVSEYANILPEGVTGNPEALRAEELHAHAWPLVAPYFEQELDGVVAQYRQFIGTGTATNTVEEAVPAAYFGRVDKMIVAADAQVWGKFDKASGTVALTPAAQKTAADVALLDAAATQVLLNGGTLYAIPQAEMPADSPVVALFRY